MRAVVQRVNSASVRVGDKTVGEIDRGLLVYLGIAKDDGSEQVSWLADKIVNLRIFDHIGKLQPNDPQPDAETAANAKTTLSLLDIAGKALVISQFTLLADTRKGRRPSFSQAAEPVIADALYLAFVEALGAYVPVQSGEFGADMQVASENDGPFTLVLEHPFSPSRVR
jgi:D-tyrosyl-tRNA(Tyr) deacylase